MNARNLTPQRRWQLEQRAQGNCPICGDLAHAYYCVPCGRKQNTRRRKRAGLRGAGRPYKYS